jgi:pSer/pThr/pTyr-binding forkhead associated (FHA) protein
MRLILEIRSGSNAGQRIALEQGSLARVGRKAQADFAFPGNAGMSGLHFSIECTGDACWVRDLNSTNGTWVNGQRMSEGLLGEGDEITAGEATFAVRIEHDESVSVGASTQSSTSQALGSSADDAARAEPAIAGADSEPSPKDRLLEMLRKDFQPLYAILDAARTPDIYKFLVEARDEAKNGQPATGSGGGQTSFRPAGAGTLEGGAQYESLYEGKPKAKLAMFAPYLVRLLPESKLLENLVNKGWGRSWGIYLTCGLDFSEVRRHLRHFLMVRLPEGKHVYFRFYDPRVLRLYLPTCLPEEVNEFFGPVKYYLVEGDKPAALLRFSDAGRGVGRKILRLAPSSRAN